MSSDNMKISNLKVDDLFKGKKIYSNINVKEDYDRILAKCTNILKSFGKNNSGFLRRKQQIIDASYNGQKISNVVNRISYIRPLISIWNDDILYKQIPCTSELILHINNLSLKSSKGRLGRLALHELCQLFFSKYSYIKCIEEISYVINNQFKRYSSQELLFGIDKLQKVSLSIFKREGHTYLAKLAEEKNILLSDAAKEFNIPIVDSTFYEECQQYYYISKLKKLYSNEDNEIIYEIQNKNIYDRKCSSNLRLGHIAIKILIDILIKSNSYPSELWLNTILIIAKDPRVPPSSQSYAYWWAQIDHIYAEKTSLWLAKADMELFLQIFKEFSMQQGDVDLRRMYPQREYFLRGLFKKKLVIGARLFLSKEASYYVDRHYNKDYKPHYIYIKGTQSGFAAFYINLGNVHIIEGTHNFQIRILSKLPPGSPLTSYIKSVDRYQITSGLINQYDKNYTDFERYEFRHTKGWQFNVLSILNKYGFNIREDDIMSRQDFYKSI